MAINIEKAEIGTLGIKPLYSDFCASEVLILQALQGLKC